jgi:hypothetical protein
MTDEEKIEFRKVFIKDLQSIANGVFGICKTLYTSDKRMIVLMICMRFNIDYNPDEKITREELIKKYQELYIKQIEKNIMELE